MIELEEHDIEVTPAADGSVCMDITEYGETPVGYGFVKCHELYMTPKQTEELIAELQEQLQRLQDTL